MQAKMPLEVAALHPLMVSLTRIDQ